MATPLLTTKLYIPQISLDLVSRPHLISRLNAGMRGKLILISAPAGFGKSTLISEWARTIEEPVTWLSLDENDNNLKRFLSYLIAAIQQIDGSIGESILASLESTDSPPIEPAITILINEIAESGVEFSLVLDDFHLITSHKINDALIILLDHLPSNAHLVISTRADPVIPLSRYRARGQMVEIRHDDLRFTEAEVTRFLNDLFGLDLSAVDIQMLLSRTEGWITGLQLAAISMEGRENKHEFITAFSGSHQYIIDYLVDEVLAHQPEEIQTFLCQTSILDRFSASLCDYVLQISNSKNILEILDKANLFLIPLDYEHNWYRYHHLFADFLHKRLIEREPEIIPKLHKRSSEWLDRNRLITEAINHSLAGEDFERAAQLVESVGTDMMMRSEFDQLTSWLDAIPRQMVVAWPWLCIIRAWMCQRWARLDEAEENLQYAERALENEKTPEPVGGKAVIRGQAAAIRALIALNRAQIPQSMEYANQALVYLPVNHFNRAVASLSLGIAKGVTGDFDDAIKIFLEARRDSLAVGNRILAQAVLLQMGRVLAMQGRLHQAAEVFNEAVQLTYQKTNLKIPYSSGACVLLANIYREWDDLDTAEVLLEEGIEIGIPAKMVDAVCVGYAILSRLYLARGDLEEAKRACQEANRIVKTIPDPEPEAMTMTLDCRVRLQLKVENYLEASKLVHEHGLDVNDDILYFHEFEHIVLARVLMYMGRKNPDNKQLLTDAQELIAKMLEVAKPVGCMREVISLLVLQALANKALGNDDQALNLLEETLLLAEPEGYVRTFVDEGNEMRELLRQKASRGIATDYVIKLLNAFEPDRSDLKRISQSLVEPLSGRELEVLRMLATELSGPEIARELMISLNTMRTHTKNIYSKLNVNSRRAALSKANELNLL
ncbi:MAG: helix-turn-helix transcriptional regulator [Chloroflexota bacterium]|nr:MAG: helix-turn-helix transcriptional regulator [Chloroflexota bacterium]